jgi:hypothetical protein
LPLTLLAKDQAVELIAQLQSVQHGDQMIVATYQKPPRHSANGRSNVSGILVVSYRIRLVSIHAACLIQPRLVEILGVGQVGTAQVGDTDLDYLCGCRTGE